MKNIKKVFIPFLMAFIVTSWVLAASYRLEDIFNKNKTFVLFDFDNKSPVNSLYGQSGIFDLDPNDKEAFCRSNYIQDDSLHKSGYSLNLHYKVSSSKPAFNGWWTKLIYADFSKLRALSISIKGDKEAGFTDFFKVELKDKTGKKIEYIIEDITDQWKTYVIPFDEFDGPTDTFDWTNMNEFVIVFEDWRLKVKEGKILFDDISFVTMDDKTPTFAEISKRSKNQNTEIASNKEPIKEKSVDTDTTKTETKVVSNTVTTTTVNEISSSSSSVSSISSISSVSSVSSVKENEVTNETKLQEISNQKDVSVEVNQNKAIEITLKNIQFKPNSAEFAENDNKTLDLIVDTLKAYKDKKITITGHTADYGDKKAQLVLSIARAKSVYDYIMKKFPFDPKLVKYQGKGGTEPIADNKTPEGMAKNRRVELLIE